METKKYPTYKEQFDKLTTAYIKNELNAIDSCACFIGNMFNKTNLWYLYGNDLLGISNRELLMAEINKHANGLYTPEEIIELEKCFMNEYSRNGFSGNKDNAMFIALEKTLELLKQIHISKGETITNLEFLKREITYDY